MGKVKSMLFDEAEKKVDTYVSYVVHRILTLNEALDELKNDDVVKIFYNKEELENIFNLKGRLFFPKVFLSSIKAISSFIYFCMSLWK